MAAINNKHPQNVPGPWYCVFAEYASGEEGCIACNLCYSSAPEIFAEDVEGNAYVKKQPSTAQEIALAQEQMATCPVEAIRSDG